MMSELPLNSSRPLVHTGFSRSLARMLLFFSGGIFVFLIIWTTLVLAVNTIAAYQAFGLYSEVHDIYLYRLVLYALLSYGFNFFFGLYFGILYMREISRGVLRGSIRVLNVGLIAFAAWCVFFNLPVILDSFIPALRYYLSTGHYIDFPWPSQEIPPSIRFHLTLFFPMGNSGLFTGFCGSVAAILYRHFLFSGKSSKSSEIPVANCSI